MKITCSAIQEEKRQKRIWRARDVVDCNVASCLNKSLHATVLTFFTLPFAENITQFLNFFATDNRRPAVTLMTLLWIFEGRNIIEDGHGIRVSVPGSTTRNNFYLVSRMFWTNDTSKSSICWGANDPRFNFRQVCCFFLTMLTRLCLSYSLLLQRVAKGTQTQSFWGVTSVHEELTALEIFHIWNMENAFSKDFWKILFLKNKRIRGRSKKSFVNVNTSLINKCENHCASLHLDSIKKYQTDFHVWILWSKQPGMLRDLGKM